MSEPTSPAQVAPHAALDQNATTTPLGEVVVAISEALALGGNPSSLHESGRAAARLLSASRARVADWLGCPARSVVFTSGGTESCRLAILGALAAGGTARRHVVATEIEHSAVRDLLRALAAQGVETTWIRPGADGAVRTDAVANAIRGDTALVAVQWANNETGVVQPVPEIAEACRAHGVPLLSDAVQAAGKLSAATAACGAGLIAVSAHKIHGPRGVGALVIADGTAWRSPFPASHEAGRRAGTEPLPLIAGFAAAAAAAARVTDLDRARIAALRDRLERTLTGALGTVRVNGGGLRISNTTNLGFGGVDGDRLLAILDRRGVEASGGSACHAASPEPSHVLLAMGSSSREARAAVRFSLSRFTTEAEISHAIAVVIEAVETLRASSRTR